jgi:DNA-binding XRE family transcriptional regulator
MEMVKSLDEVLAALPKKERQGIAARAQELSTLYDLRRAAEYTQVELAAALHVRQDTISRLEKRSDMMLSTLRRYVEGMGGKLDIVVQFPGRPPVRVKQLNSITVA